MLILAARSSDDKGRRAHGLSPSSRSFAETASKSARSRETGTPPSGPRSRQPRPEQPVRRHEPQPVAAPTDSAPEAGAARRVPQAAVRRATEGYFGATGTARRTALVIVKPETV